MPRRIGGVPRLPQTFDAIDIGEQLAWSRGQPRIEAEPQPGNYSRTAELQYLCNSGGLGRCSVDVIGCFRQVVGEADRCAP